MAIDLQPAIESDPESAEREPSWRRRIIGPMILVLSGVATWVVAPEVITATFSGPGPLFRVAAVVVGFVVLSAVVGRLVPNPWVARAIVAVPAIAVTWWSLSPYLVDDVVDEAFPVAANATDATDPTPPTSAPPVASTTPVDVSSRAAPPAPAVPPTPQPPPAPAEPVALGSGSFQGLTGHRGSGTATIYELPDGARVVRLEDFDVSNGPGLEIHLVPGADQRGLGGGVKLGDLRGNVGNQNYDVPVDLDLAGEWTVLIWCAPFTVEVANATASF